MEKRKNKGSDKKVARMVRMQKVDSYGQEGKYWGGGGMKVCWGLPRPTLGLMIH